MPYKTLSSNKVNLSIGLRFYWSSSNHRLFRYTIEMEERTKIACNLDDSSIKVGNSVFGKKSYLKIIAAYKTKNASSMFFFSQIGTTPQRHSVESILDFQLICHLHSGM